MARWKLCFGAAVLLFSISCATGTPAEKYQTAKLSEVLEDSDKFDGEFISLDGYAVIEFENTNVFLNQSAAIDEDSKRCVSLLITKTDYEEYSLKYDQQNVVIKGLFRKKVCAHGEICTWYCSPLGIEVSEIAFNPTK